MTSSIVVHDHFRSWWEDNQDKYNGLLIDLDGTMMTKGIPLPGAQALLAALRIKGFPYCFLTNDGDHSREEKSLSLQKGGLNIQAEEIISCSQGLNLFVHEQQQHGELYFVMGLLGRPCFAENAGLKVTRDISKIDQCKGVIVGEGEYDWFNVITAVINFFLRYPTAHFIVTNPDTYWPSVESKIGIGSGGKARFMCMVLGEAGVELQPIYLGKPYPRIYDFALQQLGDLHFHGKPPTPDTILALGDSLHSDVMGANLHGADSALLLTGITTPDLLKQESAELKRPDFVFNAI